MTPLLSVDKLTKRFGGLVAVGDLDFTVEEGQIVALIELLHEQEALTYRMFMLPQEMQQVF